MDARCSSKVNGRLTMRRGSCPCPPPCPSTFPPSSAAGRPGGSTNWTTAPSSSCTPCVRAESPIPPWPSIPSRFGATQPTASAWPSMPCAAPCCWARRCRTAGTRFRPATACITVPDPIFCQIPSMSNRRPARPLPTPISPAGAIRPGTTWRAPSTPPLPRLAVDAGLCRPFSATTRAIPWP